MRNSASTMVDVSTASMLGAYRMADHSDERIMVATCDRGHSAHAWPPRQLSLKVGEQATVRSSRPDRPEGWWEVATEGGEIGIVPASKVRISVELPPPIAPSITDWAATIAKYSAAVDESYAPELKHGVLNTTEPGVGSFVTQPERAAIARDVRRADEQAEMEQSYRTRVDETRDAMAASRDVACDMLAEGRRLMAAGHVEGEHWEAAIGQFAAGLALNEAIKDDALKAELVAAMEDAEAGKAARDAARDAAEERYEQGQASLIVAAQREKRLSEAVDSALAEAAREWRAKLNDAVEQARQQTTDSGDLPGPRQNTLPELQSTVAEATRASRAESASEIASSRRAREHGAAIAAIESALGLDTQSAELTAKLKEAVVVATAAEVAVEGARIATMNDEHARHRQRNACAKAEEETASAEAAEAKAAALAAAQARAQAAAEVGARFRAEFQAEAPPAAYTSSLRPFLPRELLRWLARPFVARRLSKQPETIERFAGLHERRSGTVVTFELRGLGKLLEGLVAEGHKLPAHVVERKHAKLLTKLRTLGVDVTDGSSFSTGAEGLLALLERLFGSVSERVLAAGGDVLSLSETGLVAVFFDAEGAAFGSAAADALRCAAAVVDEMAKHPPKLLRLRCALSAGWLETMILGGHEQRYEYAVTGAPFHGASWLIAAAERGEVMVSESSWPYLSDMAKGEWCLAGEDGAYRVATKNVSRPPVDAMRPQSLQELVAHADPIQRFLVAEPEPEREVAVGESLPAQTLWAFLPPPLAVEMNGKCGTGLVRQVTTLHILLHRVTARAVPKDADDDDAEAQAERGGQELAAQLQECVAIVQRAVHGRGYITDLQLLDDERGPLPCPKLPYPLGATD